tara:strand:- start:7542 stop:8639 length:1098 start_codon:yes stop_codon:yes gene_type:complete
MNINKYIEMIDSSEEFLFNLKKSEEFKYYPCLTGLNEFGNSLELGFTTFALKILKMINKLDRDPKVLSEWSEFINSFQTNKFRNIPNNFYVDPAMVSSYDNYSITDSLKDNTKKILNKFGKNYDTHETKFIKSVNAETKQAVATLIEVGFKNKNKLEIDLDKDDLYKLLNNLNWEKPWSAGGQFSTYCVYTSSQDLNLEDTLFNFVSKIANKETGSYYINKPSTNREIINGAMKVISGLSWIDKEIHYPNKLIDFCLKNRPVLEGCDVVDYVYVLFMCSQQTDHKKKEINNVLMETLSDLIKLYKKEEKGFSYFLNRSQTHYYGVKISSGEDCADIQSTTLCIWAIIMILINNDLINDKYSVIKP